MKKEDLTQVKNIGSARMKLLNSQGITTIQQLYEIPLEKLEQVKSLGQHYAKLIKEAVNDFYAKKAEPPKNRATELSQSKDKKTDKIDKNLKLDIGGDYRWRRNGEKHMFNPTTVSKLQQAVRLNNPESYAQYAKMVNEQSESLMTLRGLFEFKNLKVEC